MAIAIRFPKKAQPPSPLALPQVPGHVGIIMDGNGRWAARRSLPRLAVHRAGTENLRRVIERFADYGVSYLTLYAFSTENGIRLLHIGRLDALDPRLQQQVQEALALTKDNDRMTVCIAWNYGGRAEILEAVRRGVAQGISPGEIDHARFNHP